jgi:hypothetical protein
MYEGRFPDNYLAWLTKRMVTIMTDDDEPQDKLERAHAELRAACDELRGRAAMLRADIEHRFEMERAKFLEAIGDNLGAHEQQLEVPEFNTSLRAKMLEAMRDDLGVHEVQQKLEAPEFNANFQTTISENDVMMSTSNDLQS